MEKRRVAIWTLGCRVNQYESEAIAGLLEKDGFVIVPFGEAADVTIINTCTVTAESDRKSRQHIRKAAAISGSPVIVTGCFAQVSGEEAADIPGVAAVVGNGEKSRIPTLVRALCDDSFAGPKLLLSNMETAPYDPLTLPTPRRARAFIKIEDGCENRCAYCIIPAARGKVRSKPPAEVVAEVVAIAEAGCEEVTLTGIETAAYGRDSGGAFSLTTLLSSLSGIPGIRRIGLGSLDPSLVREPFLSAIATLPEILPHFHISLQSGSSSVLKRMRRPYNAQMAADCLSAIRRFFPDAMLTADVIVGFPGETEEEFEETVAFCQNGHFLHLHIFPYSRRKGTEAASMPDQVPDTVKKARVVQLSAVQAKSKASILADYVAAHREAPVALLIEEYKNGYALGHSEHFVEIAVKGYAGEVGETVPVLLIEVSGGGCVGVIEN